MQIGILSALPPVLMTVVVIIAGVLVDRLIQCNYVSRTLGRKLAQTLGKHAPVFGNFPDPSP